jgi:hypothetical protein
MNEKWTCGARAEAPTMLRKPRRSTDPFADKLAVLFMATSENETCAFLV